VGGKRRSAGRGEEAGSALQVDAAARGDWRCASPAPQTARRWWPSYERYYRAPRD